MNPAHILYAKTQNFYKIYTHELHNFIYYLTTARHKPRGLLYTKKQAFGRYSFDLFEPEPIRLEPNSQRPQSRRPEIKTEGLRPNKFHGDPVCCLTPTFGWDLPNYACSIIWYRHRPGINSAVFRAKANQLTCNAYFLFNKVKHKPVEFMRNNIWPWHFFSKRLVPETWQEYKPWGVLLFYQTLVLPWSQRVVRKLKVIISHKAHTTSMPVTLLVAHIKHCAALGRIAGIACAPFTEGVFSDTLMLNRKWSKDNTNMGHTIAILNQKGGVGKTTTAINLGSYLAKAGSSVLLVDFDPQGNATGGLGFDKNKVRITSQEVLFDNAVIDKAVQASNVRNLYLLPANADLATAEVTLVGEERREYFLQTALKNADYDFILIDCPPSLSLLTVNALVASNYLLIPVQAEYYALEGLGQLLDVVQRVRQGLNTELELLGVVTTMYDSRTSLSEQVYKELQKHFGSKLFKTIIPRNVRLAEAPSHGKPVSEHDKWSRGARAYKQLAKEMAVKLKGQAV